MDQLRTKQVPPLLAEIMSNLEVSRYRMNSTPLCSRVVPNETTGHSIVSLT